MKIVVPKDSASCAERAGKGDELSGGTNYRSNRLDDVSGALLQVFPFLLVQCSFSVWS